MFENRIFKFICGCERKFCWKFCCNGNLVAKEIWLQRKKITNKDLAI